MCDIFVSFYRLWRQTHLLEGCHTSEAEVLLHAGGAEDKGRREVLGLGDVAGHVGALNNALGAVHPLLTRNNHIELQANAKLNKKPFVPMFETPKLFVGR